MNTAKIENKEKPLGNVHIFSMERWDKIVNSNKGRWSLAHWGALALAKALAAFSAKVHSKSNLKKKI